MSNTGLQTAVSASAGEQHQEVRLPGEAGTWKALNGILTALRSCRQELMRVKSEEWDQREQREGSPPAAPSGLQWVSLGRV